jgi:hypothetical protein
MPMTKRPQAESIGPETHPPFIHSMFESAKQWDRKSHQNSAFGDVALAEGGRVRPGLGLLQDRLIADRQVCIRGPHRQGRAAKGPAGCNCAGKPVVPLALTLMIHADGWLARDGG